MSSASIRAWSRNRCALPREVALVVRAAEVLVPLIFAADLAPVDPRAATARVMLPGVTQPTSLRDCRFEPTVTTCSLQPSAPARGGDECLRSLVDHHGRERGRPLPITGRCSGGPSGARASRGGVCRS